MNSFELEKVLFAKILPNVLKPGRYIGHEINIIKKDLQTIKARVALAFPDVYELGMSYTGFQILYHILNSQNFIWAERVFAPWPDMEKQLRLYQVPLYTLESFTPLNQFDIIGFTLQYELTYTNILNMLDLGEVPIKAAERTADDPYVIGGGPCSCNPEPMAEFFDAFLIGDGEEAAVEMVKVITAGREQGKSRFEILSDLAQIWGVYVPAFYEARYQNGKFIELKSNRDFAPDIIRTRIAPKLELRNYPTKPIVPLIEITHDRLAIEVMRGCTEGCRYCNAGMIYRPVRERPVEDVIKQMKHGLVNTGHTEVSFLSLSISDYSHLEELMLQSRQELPQEQVNVSFPSMRLDSFTETIAEFVAHVRKSGFTFAPEAGSQRLRDVINKNISEEDLFKSVEIALRNGWKLIKFYFMIGLPTETDEDVIAIADLLKRLVNMSKSFGKVQFNVSISPFAPKAHTPFQWERQNYIDEIWKKIDLLKMHLKKEKRIKLTWRDPRVSFLEGILGRADRRMSRVIYEVWQAGGKFDGWAEYFNYELWINTLRKFNFDPDALIAEIPENEPLPWDHIDKGITKTFLQKERRKAFKQKVSLDCKTEKCLACGLQRKGVFAELVDCYKKDQQKKTVSEIAKQQKERQGSLKKPETFAQNPVKYRIQFAKRGYACFLSHLDILRIFERAFRRAQINLAYSKGFNPRPKIAFAQPLALGVQSTAEFFDVEILNPVKGSLVKKLNSVLPEGIKIKNAYLIKQKVPSLSEAIDLTEYEIVIQEPTIDLEKLDLKLAKLRRSKMIKMQKRVKGQHKIINARPFIEEIRRRGHRVFIKLKTIDRRTIRIDDLAKLIFNNNEAIIIIRRKQLIRTGNLVQTPLEILTQI